MTVCLPLGRPIRAASTILTARERPACGCPVRDVHTQLGLEAYRNNHMPEVDSHPVWRECWLRIATARALRSGILVLFEVLILSAIGVWTLIGLVRHAFKTGWTLSGLLTMLHEQWRGATIH